MNEGLKRATPYRNTQFSSMTTAIAFESDIELPKTEAALERAHLAIRELQRTLAERLLAEQESYLALERECQTLKAERDALAIRLAQTAKVSPPPTLSTSTQSALDPTWRAEVDQALGLVDQALNLLAPASKNEAPQ
jgi:hypothetical protein